MAEVILDERLIGTGEPFFIAYVDQPKGGASSIVAELAMDLVGPPTPAQLAPRKLSGFELPALELLHKAKERAAEAGVAKILLVDPHGLLSLAPVNRYASC
jgi:hypothetical protein